MKSWSRMQLPIAQMYHVTVDNAIPYNVMGNRQDGPSFHGPSNTRYTGFWARGLIPRGDWTTVGGGESGFATPDPTDPNIVWSSASGAGARGGIVVRHDMARGQFRDVEVWPESTGGYPAGDVRYRFQWTFPLLISPHDNETIFVTSQHVHRTRNRGQSWEVISPDLSTNDRSRMGISGGLTPDNIGVEFCCVIYAFDESPLQQGVFWAGTNDGLVQLSRDDGATWTDVTANIPDLPARRGGAEHRRHPLRCGEGLHLDRNTTRSATSRRAPTRPTTSGRRGPGSRTGSTTIRSDYTRYLLEDPVRPGLLYLGTETNVYISYDDGESWQLFMPNLPPTPYYGLIIQEHFNDFVAGTYGRGYWILDDLGPVQQLTPEIAASDAHLFEPRDAYRFNDIVEPMVMFEDWSVGENPPNGASINYWLADGGDGEVQVRVENSDDETLATLDGANHDGFNRVWWELPGTGRESDPLPHQAAVRGLDAHARGLPAGRGRLLRRRRRPETAPGHVHGHARRGWRRHGDAGAHRPPGSRLRGVHGGHPGPESAARRDRRRPEPARRCRQPDRTAAAPDTGPAPRARGGGRRRGRHRGG